MKLFISTVFIIYISFFTTIYISAESSEEITLDSGEIVTVFLEKLSDGYKYEVEFENGHYYSEDHSADGGMGLWSHSLTEEEIYLAREAIDKYEEIHGDPADRSSINPIGILVIILGLFFAIFPYAAWYLEIGWKLNNAEPSDLVLFFNRAGGIIGIVIGLFILF
ncbi:DUF6199 family natural product biosynthesis protein [Gracilibacillus alcaliphilus]|uniref:DUF6199 family natural product biosynthesis protein n=1 Tax=Gracilibacillus alcaliphilus TaxID=1401441 RepID=UPI001956295D|nr:DUF6199 family natural product biosynthesis protein [Gracilibacillus alcaliphilus]MBM7678859.1 hypothetical protein [Gracilibacillus alcaliphilus]